MKTYAKHQEVRFSVEFRNLAKALADPSTVTYRLMSPSGTETTYVYSVDPELVRDSTGRYHVDIVLSESGRWTYNYRGTGTIDAAAESTVLVEMSVFA